MSHQRRYIGNTIRVYKILRERRRDINGIAKRLEISQRSAYRYIDHLNAMGFLIDKDFRGNYFVHDDFCPFCKCKSKKQHDPKH